MPLPEKVLRWYYETQLLLKEQFDIDTARKEDMGRVHTLQTKVLTLKDDPQKVENVKAAYLEETDRQKRKALRSQLVPSEMRPVPLGEELNPRMVPSAQRFRDENPYQVTEQFAFMKRGDDGQNYVNAIPEYEDDYHTWMLKNQNTFHVKETNGKLVMESSLNEAELLRIYQEAKDGRVFVNGVTGDIRKQDGSGMFLSVDQNGSPILVDLALNKVQDLGKEKVKTFYEKHPELMEVSAESIEVDTLARCEMTDIAQCEDPHLINDRMYYGLQDLQNQSGVNSTDEERDRLMYDKQFWWEMHNGKTPIDFAQFREINSKIPDLLSERLGVHPNFTDGGYLQNCFVSENGQLRPLFPDHRALMTQGDMEIENAVKLRMAQAMNNGGFLFCREDPSQPGEYDSVRVSYHENGNPMVSDTPREKPRKPRFFGWKKFWNGINHKWYKRELDDYRLNSQLFASAGQELPDAVQALNAEEMPKKHKEKQLSPEEQARAEKLAQMTPEQQFSYQIAEGVLTKLRRSAMPKIFLAALDQTPEDIQKTEKFRAYMHTPEATEWLKRMNAGEVVNYNVLGDNCLKFEVGNKAEDKENGPTVPQNVPTAKKDEKNLLGGPAKNGP